MGQMLFRFAATVVEQIARDLKLPESVKEELIDSGAPRFPNQVAWARFYLAREGYLDSSKRGVWSLTDKGRTVRLTPEESRAIFLKWVKVYAEARKKRKKSEPPETKDFPFVLFVEDKGGGCL